MSSAKIHTAATDSSEVVMNGTVTAKGVKIVDPSSMEQLLSRGYGSKAEKGLLLAFHEAMYLMEKNVLNAKGKKNKKLGIQGVLQFYEMTDDNAWVKYLTYRDLRSRGYVVREGFGSGVDFRVYDRGEYSRETAKYLVLGVQEDKPISMTDLAKAVAQSLSLKKELVLAVMNRRGEIVYYSISELLPK